MNLRCVMMAAAVMAAPAAGASAQGYYGYGAPPPPPPYVYTGASAPRPTCDQDGFTLLGAHAGVTVLGFGLNGGASFTAPSFCGGYGSTEAQAPPQFEPRPYAPPPPPMSYAPPPAYTQAYGYQGGGEEGYGYSTPPCGCGPQGW